ncbi:MULTISPECIES: glycosyltransferase [unclassified Haematospirillum]|uniref:glycosyltransferase n=1 Tax=unclassified Haematospirillum TaxID=2622088 RepID=UPI00143A1EE8|nr:MULTISPECIES: glycosyltransferase [unclassified Haematospirillum]NKD55478.1 glycosyltransferase family 4 protein [Haematospirillum sp. H4890]NKD75618.1 glycosyltransferase family 4 protein [Haematospirillum sp. H4485]
MHVLMFHARYRLAGGEDVSVELDATRLRSAGVQVTQMIAPALGRCGTVWPGVWGHRVARMLEHGSFDLLHVQNFFPAATTAVHHAAFHRGIPVVQHLRNARLLCPSATLWRGEGLCVACRASPVPGIYHGCWRNSRMQTLLSACMVRWQRKTWDQVSAFVTPSAFLRDILAPVLDRSKAVVVLNSAPDLVPCPPAQRSGVVYAGRLSPEKGVDVFLQAVRALDPSVPVSIYGTGPMEAEVRACDRIKVYGHVPLEDIYRAMEKAQVVVVPSLWPEPFGRAALEGMAAGAAVVASAVGGLPEVLGPTGFLVPPGDPDALGVAIQMALVEYAAVGTDGYRRARSLFTSIDPLLEVYRRCIEQSSSKASQLNRGTVLT